MSRCAVDVGGRAARYILQSQLVATTSSTGLAASALSSRSTPTIPIALRGWTAPISARSFASSARTQRDVATKDTLPKWSRPTAPITAQLGLRSSAFTSSRWQAGRIARSFGHDLAWTQRRFRSDVPKKPRSSSVEQKATEEASHISKHALGAGANKSLYDRLPHLHRPTKQELLAAATGFWHRLSIHFKWFSIRSARPFNADDIGAFLSWIFWGHVLWIVLGTTTFVSLAIWALNTVFAQETLAGWVGNYLTQSSGVKIVFESAIVPTWRDGVITFNNVFLSRRPGHTGKRERAVSKGSSATAAAAAAAEAAGHSSKDPEDDGNYSQFDVTIQSVNVTLSFAKWFNGKGLLRDVEIKGVRGVIDRTHVHPIEGDEKRDPKSYRHEHNTGDFEIDNFKMEDVLLSVHQPRDFRPFNVSVYTCELPRLRKQWLFYDFMSANSMSGSFDDSLFTVHPRQVHSVTGASLGEGVEGEDAGHWKKHSRLRIDGLQIDHLNRGVDGPFSWIQEGNVDIVADVMLPHDADAGIAKVMSDFYDRMEATVTAHSHGDHSRDHVIRHDRTDSQSRNYDEQQSHQQQSTTADQRSTADSDRDNRFVVLDIRVHLNDVRASVPLFTKDLSYVNNAVVRPIVAYINSRRSFIPVHCRVVKRQTEFDGSWTIFDSGLLDDLSRETYDAFVTDLGDERQQRRRIRKVGVWTLQLAAQALFIGLAGA